MINRKESSKREEEGNIARMMNKTVELIEERKKRVVIIQKPLPQIRLTALYLFHL